MRTYWARILGGAFFSGLAIGAGALGVILVGGAEETMHLAMGIAAAVAVLTLMVLSVFWTIQRAHDLGWHAAFVLLNFVPVVGVATSLYFSLAPGKAEENAHGAPRETSRREKALGTIGLVAIVAYLLLAAWGGYLTGVDEG